MSTKQPHSPIIEPLLKALADCEMSRLRLSKESGISRLSIIRFERGDDVRGNVLEKLATYFGFELTPTSNTKGKK